MTKRQAVVIFLIALAVRLAYHQLVPAFDGSYDNGSDSGKYIWRALSILEYGEEAVVGEIPLGEMANPEDVANVVVFLASGLARHATGASIDVNVASYVR